jgi:dihydroorotate dehydrogenase electron transfer subunit
MFAIISHDEVAPEYFCMRIASPEIAAQAVPGQFVMLKVQAESYDPLLRIPLAIHQIHSDGISVLYHVVGTGTKILSQKKVGDEIDVLGSLGNGFTITKHTEALLVAGGFGVAPLYALAEELRKQHKKIKIFIGAKSKAHVIGAEDFKQLSVEVNIVTEDGSLGEQGLVTDFILPHLSDDVILYASGPDAMLQAVAAIAKQKKVTAQLSLEAYMACGIGVCRGCAIKTNDGYKMCCKDGPVFSADVL